MMSVGVSGMRGDAVVNITLTNPAAAAPARRRRMVNVGNARVGCNERVHLGGVQPAATRAPAAVGNQLHDFLP